MKESRKKYLLKNTAVFALGSMGTKLISFFLIPLYTNILSTSEYGIADLVTTISTVVAPVIILNISEAVMRFSLDKNADNNKIMSTGILTFLMAVFIGLLIIPFVNLFETLHSYVIHIYFYTISLAGSQLFLSYLRGREKLVAYSVGNILHTLEIASFNILFLLVFKLGIIGYFWAYILANVATIIYAFIAGNVIDVIKNFKFDKELSKNMIIYSSILIPNSFMWWITNSSDRIMLTAMVGAAANGIYAISYKVPSLVQTITNIFNQAWSYSAIRENESSDRDKFSNDVYDIVVAISTVSGVSLLMIMKTFMKYYVEENYYEAWKYTPFLIIGYVFLTLGTFLSTYYTVNKDSKGFLFSASCGALVNIILNICLIPLIGVYGAALATGISYFVVYLYRTFDTRKYISIKFFNFKHIMAYIILLLSGITIFIDNIIGQILLIIEFFIVVFLFKNKWTFIFKKVINKFIH
ncbi:MAG: oligosaccharide flippase family protein [Ruminococcus flavefaciens]|nr:oligosaccharide flippase family protein [Ruminococcus flavefaciens]